MYQSSKHLSIEISILREIGRFDWRFLFSTNHEYEKNDNGYISGNFLNEI